jgi:hypothetical protein
VVVVLVVEVLLLRGAFNGCFSFHWNVSCRVCPSVQS